MTEQDFQQRLRLALRKAIPSIRLWRQPAGRIRTDRGTWVECAPVGAADLTGVHLGTGRRVEVEVKGRRTPVRPDQIAWLDSLRGHGAIAVLVRDDGTPDAVARAIDAIRAALP